ncbi:MAG TPA: hypothetical protein PKY73_01905 [Hyphomonas sp.]|nr:hypothetical protein [Hyphomonas sp.]
MRHPARLLLPLALLATLAACHTDPFGLKPEVRGVEIPERQAGPAEAPAEETGTEADKSE